MLSICTDIDYKNAVHVVNGRAWWHVKTANLPMMHAHQDSCDLCRLPVMKTPHNTCFNSFDAIKQGVSMVWKSEDGTPAHNEHISLFVMTYISHARQYRPLLMADCTY